MIDSSTILARLNERFEFDRWTALAAGVYLLFTAAYLSPILPPPWVHVLSYYLLEPVFLTTVVLALWGAARHAGSADMRVFFRWLIAAYLFWLTAAILKAPLQATFGGTDESLILDILFALYYLAFLIALEVVRQGREASRTERYVGLIGSVVLVVGSLVYLRIVPEVTGLGPFGSRLALHGLLDLYIALRMGVLAWRSWGTPLFRVFGLLSVSLALVAAGDALELAYQVGALVYNSSSVLNALWLQLYVPLFLAARAKVASREPGTEDPLETVRARMSLGPKFWSPLIAYGFALPVAHVFIYSVGTGDPLAESLRGYLVMAWLVVLAILIFVQQAAIASRLGASELSLDESYERIRALTNARETAIEKERTLLANRLQDDLGQLLVALQMDISWLWSRRRNDQPAVERRLNAAGELVESALGFAQRVATGLHPRVLDEAGLGAALEALVDDTNSRGSIAVRLISSGDLPIGNSERDLTLYRIAQESLTNCLKHARATRADVRLTVQRGWAELEVRDNGIGIEEMPEPSESGLGILSIRERIRAVDGEFAIGVGLDGRGCSIKAIVPLTSTSSGTTVGESPAGAGSSGARPGP